MTDKNQLNALIQEAETSLNSGNYQRALSYFEKAQKIEPFNIRVKYGIGLTYYYLKNYDMAIQYLLSILPVVTKEVKLQIYSIVLSCFYSIGAYIEVINNFNILIQTESPNDEMLIIKGKALYQLGKVDEALDCFKKALNINPSSNLASLYRAALINELKLDSDFMESVKNKRLISIQGIDNLLNKLLDPDRFKKIKIE